MILINKNLNVVIILLAIVFVSACAPSEEVKLLQAIVEAKENDDPVLLDKITNGGSVLSKRSNLLDGKFYEVVL
ncbi:MAG: hypothetical protein OEZ58_23105, partial [Gammaproteobacteria bacterium]|nr:hypothetical protein [Gammaproteobacteria bacterium]